MTETLWPIEKRILAYLDQRGPTDRIKIVCDLADPDSNIGRGHVNGSNGATTLIFGSWSRRLLKNKHVQEMRDGYGICRSVRITDAGRKLLRESE